MCTFFAEHPDEYQGPLKNRSCTDVICLLIFIVFVVLWAVIGIWSTYLKIPDIVDV